MKFSTESIEKIEQILVAELAQQMEREEIRAEELEQALRNRLQEIGRKSYGKMLSLLDQQHGILSDCECGYEGKRVSQREAQVLSVFGWSTYRRSYYQCACGTRWFALDQEHNLRAGQATHGMGRLLGLAGVTVSFEEASRQIQEYLQVDVCANTIRQETQQIGQKQAECEQNWIEQSQDLAYLQARERQPPGPQQIYGSIDGAFVPLEEEWKEAKTVSWYQVGSRYGTEELQAQEIAYYTSLEPAETFGELLWGTGVHHQADRSAELIFVCDGATWIWKLVTQYFPSAIQIVDWYHASQYLHAVANELLEPEKDHWLTEMKTLLWEGQIEDIIQACRALVKQVGQPAQRLISYYTNNLQRMQYADFRSKGYFIGSGTVESACKQIVTMRLKRSGARWTHRGAALTAKARTAWLSNTWHSVTQLPLAA